MKASELSPMTMQRILPGGYSLGLSRYSKLLSTKTCFDSFIGFLKLSRHKCLILAQIYPCRQCLAGLEGIRYLLVL